MGEWAEEQMESADPVFKFQLWWNLKQKGFEYW